MGVFQGKREIKPQWQVHILRMETGGTATQTLTYKLDRRKCEEPIVI